MYRRLEYKHDYFGDVEIAKQKQQKHYPLVIHVENLSLSLSHSHPIFFWKWGKEVPIFSNLNFEIQFGKLIGVVGNDVNVCSALLRTLACKIPGVNKNASTNTTVASEIRNGIRFTHSGHIYYNEKYPSKETLSIVDFVSKGNHFYPFVTVRETILHFARIQYPHLDDDDLAEKVVKVINEMGLSMCSANPIGTGYSKNGITAEDKIRLRIALQMLNNPSVIFLEDPFDGLDDFVCNNLITLFTEICSRGPSVVFSQGADKTQHTGRLHSVIALSDAGELVYAGHAGDELEKYLSGSGQVVEKGFNPLDKLLQTAHEEYNQQSRGLIDQFQRKTKEPNRSNTSSTQKLPPELTEDLDPMDEYETLGLRQQLKPLFLQTLKNTFRNKKVMMLYLFELVLLALVPCVLFWRIVNGSAQPWDTLGFSFYLSSIHPYVLFVGNLYRVTQDIPALLQEHATAKRPRAFPNIVTARFLFQLLLDLGASLLFSTLVYWDTKSMSGSGTYSFLNFLIFVGVSLLVHFSSVSLAFLSGSLFGSFFKSFVFGTIFSAINFMVTGFLLNSNIFPGYLHWVQYIPYQSYAYELYIIVANDIQPVITTGNIHSILLNMPFSSRPIIFRCVVLLLFIAFNHVLGGFMLWKLFKRNHRDTYFEPIRREISGKSATANYNSFFDTKHVITSRVCVALVQITAKDNSQEILRGINGVCKSGELILALGDKESGLKALLDIIGGIYKEVSGKTAEIIGGVHINNYQPHSQFLQKLVGYVHSGVLCFGKISAKETIRYYALLKMSRDSPLSEKQSKADNLLREFGFGERMYTPACDLNAEFKLRLSIAIQMLNNPLIVIVNDQLKGLDYTSQKDILDLLKKIAQQGRVVICAATYGQGWMMKSVDNLMLLTQGNIAYFGRSGNSFLRHMKRIGFDVPPFNDAILYAQSLLSVDRHTGATEVESKNRIRSIVEKWSTSENSDEINEVQKLQFPKIQMLIDTRGYERNILLVKRMMFQRLKQPIYLAIHILMPLVFSACVCMVFSSSLSLDLYGVQSRMGIITAFSLYIVFGFMQAFLFFPKENEIFIKDHQANNCTPLAFYLSYFSCEFALNFVSGVIVALMVMFINHMHVSAQSYFCFAFFILLLLSSGQAFSTIIVSLVSHTDVSIAIFSVGVAIVISFSSFLSTDCFVVLDFIRYASTLSNISYVFAIHEFRSLSFACHGPSLLFTHACPVKGEMILEAFKLKDAGSEGLLIGLAVISSLCYQIIAFICFSKIQHKLTKR